MRRQLISETLTGHEATMVAPVRKHRLKVECKLMGWATQHIAMLKDEKTVSFRPRGHSMKPKIKSGQLCTVVPVVDHGVLEVGDIVLCKVRGSEYLHLIKAIQGGRFQIGNNRGHINGWVGPNSIFGRLTNVED